MQFATLEALHRSKLCDIGLCGNGVIRLFHRDSSRTLEEIEAELASGTCVPENEPRTGASVVAGLGHVDGSSQPSSGSKDLSSINGIGIGSSTSVPSSSMEVVEDPNSALDLSADRDMKVFSPESAKPNLMEDLPDSFYEMTEADARILLASYKRRREQEDSSVLKTRAIREREEQQMRAKYPKVGSFNGLLLGPVWVLPGRRLTICLLT